MQWAPPKSGNSHQQSSLCRPGRFVPLSQCSKFLALNVALREDWSDEQLGSMAAWGNARANELWENGKPDTLTANDECGYY